MMKAKTQRIHQSLLHEIKKSVVEKCWFIPLWKESPYNHPTAGLKTSAGLKMEELDYKRASLTKSKELEDQVLDLKK